MLQVMRRVAVLLFAISLLPVPAVASAATDEVVFEGSGWGHGVGLSQYGAQGMALLGSTAEEILTHYYRGTVVEGMNASTVASFWIEESMPVWVNIIEDDSPDGYLNNTVTFRPEGGPADLCWDHDDLLAATCLETPAQDGELWRVRKEGDACTFDQFGDGSWLTRTAPTTCTFEAYQLESSDVIGASVRPGEETRIRMVYLTYHGRYPEGKEYEDGILRVRHGSLPRQGVHATWQTSIESYVAGLDEIPDSWEPAAIEAQVVAARSYGIRRGSTRGSGTDLSIYWKLNCYCNLRSTNWDQVFNGASAADRNPNLSASAAASAGTIVTHDGWVIDAVYSSSSGGVTERNSDYWGGTQVPYLDNEDDSTAKLPAANNPNASWTKVFSVPALASKLGWDTVTKVEVTARTSSGSALTVHFEGVDGGVPVETDKGGNETRILLDLLSRYYDVSFGTDPDSLHVGDTPGFVDTQSRIHLFTSHHEGAEALPAFYYGNPGDVPFSGDWDCDGEATPGMFRQSDGYVYLRNSNTQGNADVSFFFGNPGDQPLAGDFDGDGCDTVSVWRASEGRVFIINKLGENGGGLGAAEYAFYFGNPGDKPFIGDFDGDGTDTVGLHRESTGFVYFRNTLTEGVAEFEFFYGDPGDVILAGDWDGDGVDSVAVYRRSNGTFYVKNSNSQGNADFSTFVGDYPHAVVGPWDAGP